MAIIVENILKGYAKLKKSLKGFKFLDICLLCFWLVFSNAWAADYSSIGVLHPPVVVSVEQQKISVFFLKNNLKSRVEGMHVANAEIFVFPMNFGQPELKYVWKVEGEQIVSVFFYDWKSQNRSGKSMYVLTRSRLLNDVFDGATYSTMELPIIKDGDKLSVSFFPGESGDPYLHSCNEGWDLVTGKAVQCGYKDADSIKKYFSSLDS